MAHRTLDMGKAWTQATGLIGANKDTIGAIAGLFFFLPVMASGLLVPDLAGAGQPTPPPDADPELVMRAMLDQMTAIYAANWPLLLAVTVVQFVGSLALFALLTDRGNPTVGEALRTVMASVPSYFVAQLLTMIGAAIGIGIPLGLITALGGPVAAIVGGLVAFVVIIYVAVKTSLTGPVVAIEELRNPIAALARSWQLTKGNSLRILLFVALLALVMTVIATLVSGIIGLVLSALGETIAHFGGAVLDAAVNTIFSLVLLVVNVAIHRQLTGGAPEGLAAAFE